MHKSKSALKNEIYIIFWYFKIKSGHLILAKSPDLVINNKKEKKRTGRIVDYACPPDHRVKI